MGCWHCAAMVVLAVAPGCNREGLKIAGAGASAAPDDRPLDGPSCAPGDGVECSDGGSEDLGVTDLSDAAPPDGALPPDMTAPPDLAYVAGPSCAGLAATCGASANDNCCNSPVVTGGTFKRSYDVAADNKFPDQSYPATVSDFRLDKYEVTVGRFRMFVAAGMGTQANPPPTGAGAHPKIAGSGWDASFNSGLAANNTALVAALKCLDGPPFGSGGTFPFYTWTDAVAGNENRPINCLDWYEAFAFCIWDGGRLPTEAEWNYAAAGGSEQRAFPWSNPPGSLVTDETYVSYWVDNTRECFGDGVNGCAMTDLILVGTKAKGDGRWGQSDLAGNVIEHVLDWFASYSNPCSDCATLTEAPGLPFRTNRGGSFADVAYGGLRVGERDGSAPGSSSAYYGARCARSK